MISKIIVKEGRSVELVVNTLYSSVPLRVLSLEIPSSIATRLSFTIFVDCSKVVLSLIDFIFVD